ncbi:MAG: serine/threonine-protein kinase [Pirellulales bacterium]
MPVTIPDFWKLAVESRLLTPEICQQLAATYEQTKGSLDPAASKTLADWLVSINVLSKYQATVLVNGRSGPFFYGEYKVYDRIDAGRWKGLFRAVHAPTNHPVLLQFVTGAVTQDPQHWAYVVGQVHNRLTAAYPHWHRFHEVVDLGNFKFLVAEDLAGDSLDQRLATAGRVAPPEACIIVRHLALALAQLHRWQLPHGDVRPANIWLDARGHARLLQDPTQLPRPLAKNPGESEEAWGERADYAAPELQQTGKIPDAQTDIYALGCCFYQLITGQPPFAGGDATSKLQRHATEAIQPLAPFGVPEPLAKMIAFMMAKNPQVRFPQAQLVADQLAPFIDPARLNAALLPAAPTLPLFEQFLQQRGLGRTSPAFLSPPPPAPAASSPPSPPPSSPPPSSPPPPAPAAPPAPPKPASVAPPASASLTSTAKASTTRTSAAPSAASPAVSPPASPAAKPAAKPVVVPRPTPPVGGAPAAAPMLASGGADTAARIRQAGEASKQKMLVVGSVFAAVLLVGAVVGVVMFGGKGSSESGEAGESVASAGGNAAASGTTGGQPVGGAPVGGQPASGQPAVGGSPGVSTPPAGGVPGGNAIGKKKWEVKAEPTSDKEEGATGLRQSVVADDGKSLWESPTTGAPVQLEWVPPGAQVFLILRPHDLMASTEGPRVLQALGPALGSSLADLEKILGLPFDEIEQLIVTLHDAGEAFPRPAFVVHSQEDLDVESLAGKWNAQPSDEKGKALVYQAGTWHYALPTTETKRVFLVGAAEEVQEVAKIGGAAPALRREMEKLRRLTDDQRHFTLLLAPNYLSSTLFRDGRKFYFGEAKKLREPLDWFLRDELQAVLLSLHVEPDTYVEMRLSSNFNKDRYKLAEEFRDRLEQVPDLAFDFIATLGSNPYWERVRLQYPNMIRFLHSKARIGVEEDTATINARLPAPAAHNLVFGSEMVLASNPGAMAVAVAKPTGPMNTATGGMPPGIMTVEDVLAKYKTTMAFEAQSLEFALQDIAKDVNESLKGLPFEFAIKIMGDDLKLDGITRNQTVRDFSQRDKTVGEILTAMVMKANPVTTVKEPHEKDQKLLWVIEKDPDDPSKLVVLITTRQISEQKKYKLPAVFQPK